MPRMHDETQGANQQGSATDDLKNKASQIGQSVRDMSGNISDAAREQYSHLRDQASDYYRQGREKASELEEGVESYIKEKPLQALLIAAGVGLLLGLMWRKH